MIMSCPAQLRKLSDRYKGLFPAKSYPHLSSMFMYFWSQSRSMSDFARKYPKSRSVSALSRFINRFDGGNFMERIRSSSFRRIGIENIKSNMFMLAIDDTDNPKFGKAFRAGNWHGSKGYYAGQRILTLILLDIANDTGIPLGYRFAMKRGTPDYRPTSEFVLDLLDEAVKSGLPTGLNVVMDSWFDSSKLINDIVDRGFHATWEIKKSRLVKDNPGRFVPWKKVTSLTFKKGRCRLRHRLESKRIRKRKKRAPCGARQWIRLKGMRSQVSVLAVFPRHNARKAFGYWASTDKTLSPERIWELSRGRWRIETMFRDLKQNLSFGRLPSGKENAADLAICLPFAIYTSVQLERDLWLRGDQSLSQCLGRHRQAHLTNDIINFARDRRECTREPVIARLCPTRANRKPVNQAAGSSSMAA